MYNMHKMETIFKKSTNADLLYNGCTKLCVHIVKCTVHNQHSKAETFVREERE